MQRKRSSRGSARQPAPALSTHGSFFLVASADDIFRRQCQSRAFSRLVFVLRKQRFPERQQLSLTLICIHILELQILFFFFET